MVELKKYKGELEKFAREKQTEGLTMPGKEQNPPDEVVLFFSFDIVNSTLYKTRNYYGWAGVLTELFAKLKQRVEEGIAEAELWKFLGDEAVFLVRIKALKDVHFYISAINEILLDSIQDLKNGTLFNCLESFGENERELMKLQNILSLQAASWIAVISAAGRKEEPPDNIFKVYKISKTSQFYEFLGNDMDTGFRISKYTSDGRLVVSFELAYLLAEREEGKQRLHIITYKKLKGVWNERAYPVIWFHDREKAEGRTLEQTFAYDESENNSLVREYYEKREERRLRPVCDTDMLDETAEALKRILKDVGLQKKIDRIKEGIRKTDKSVKAYIQSPLLELHCAAVCYEPASGRILIAKRQEGRSGAGKWEFGCAKASLGLRISESLISEYQRDFGISIEPVMDESRSDREPVPLALYQIYTEDGLQKGVITLARICGCYRTEDFKETARHAGVRWISKEEARTFEEDAVEDFRGTLKLAFQKIEELERERDRQ